MKLAVFGSLLIECVSFSQIDELDEKVKNMMMLKFGRLVDLEKLETVSVNRTVEELKEKLRQQEVKAAKDVAKWDVSKALFQWWNLIGPAKDTSELCACHNLEGKAKRIAGSKTISAIYIFKTDSSENVCVMP